MNYGPPLLSGGGAPTDAQYLALVANANLSDERVFTGGRGLTVTDSGAGAAATLDLDGVKYVWDYFANQGMIDSSGAGWPTTVIAPPGNDAVATSRDSREMIHTAVTGFGMQFVIPAAVTNCQINIVSRGTGTGGPWAGIIRASSMPDAGAVDAFGTAVVMTAKTMPASTVWNYDTQTISLATLAGGLAGGERGQIQMTRDQVGEAADTLATSIFIYHVQLVFS